ncbi:unnamed protein product [Prunus armeniaca]|uniref:Uncharacterized protein n=1 Tax=Prunus armeniaca TaxID=36596 RepID=A0A6J5TL37_PRUAR|nr:unnamed protein product [Prunus armeniaca]
MSGIPQDSSRVPRNSGRVLSQFYTIVNSNLRHPMAAPFPLHKFILKCDRCTSHSAINNLIRATLDRQVKELDLCIAPHDI